MISISQCKKMAKQQLKGTFGTLMTASLIIAAINSMLAITQLQVSRSLPTLSFAFVLIQFCITAILSFGFTYLSFATVKKRSNSFSDFQVGLTKVHYAVGGKIWHELFIVLWQQIFFIPAITLIYIPFFSLLIKALNLDNVDPETVDPNLFSPENLNIDSIIEQVTNELFAFFTNHIFLLILLVLLVVALIVLTIIKTIQYSQMFFVLSESSFENKKITISKAMKLSMQLTKKHKGYVFGFAMSFMGWILLVTVPVVACAILYEMEILKNYFLFTSVSSLCSSFAYAFLKPYMAIASVNIYGSLKQEAINSRTLRLEDFE